MADRRLYIGYEVFNPSLGSFSAPVVSLAGTLKMADHARGGGGVLKFSGTHDAFWCNFVT